MFTDGRGGSGGLGSAKTPLGKTRREKRSMGSANRIRRIRSGVIA